MVPPLLKLEFTQGPRAGDSINFKSGSTIQIGRIVRGNEIAIKDAGISSKHLRIVSDSEKWIIQDLESSNGTILNSETIDPDTPVILSHGDEIKLGEYTSIVVNFVGDLQAPKHKLPPRPRRNINKRLAVSDPDPVESVQEKPTRMRRSSKQAENELPKRSRALRKRTLEDIEELEVESEKNVISRIGRQEKKGNSGVRKGENSESVQKLGLNPIKLEVKDTQKGVGISEVKSRKRASRSKQIENACLGLENVKSKDTVFEERVEKRISRANRSKKTEVGGDYFLELERVLNQAREIRPKRKIEDRNDAGEGALKKCHGEEGMENEFQGGCSERNEDECDKEDEKEGDGSKKVEQVDTELVKKSTIGEDHLNCTVREDGETEIVQDIEEVNENEATEGWSERSDDKCDKEDERECDGSKRVEQVDTELWKKSTIGEDDLNCTVREDGETENLQDIEEECCDEERECKVEEAGIATLDDGCAEEKVEQGSSSKNVERVEVDLEKMTLGNWFDYMEVQLRKEITEKTEKMIECMRRKALLVRKHITEQKEKGVK